MTSTSAAASLMVPEAPDDAAAGQAGSRLLTLILILPALPAEIPI
jgi:hypothetical protein